MLVKEPGNTTTVHTYLTNAKSKRIESIDLLRGIVMIIMAIDHVRDYFHYDAFLYDPTNLTKTNVPLFFTRWITNFCAPVFIFLAGISARLYGAKKSKRELSFYLLTRGLWLVFVEIFILSLEKTFNPSYSIITLQVIWAIGICMIILSALIYLKKQLILFIAIILIAGHNFLDAFHVSGNSASAFIWSILHEPKEFVFGSTTVFVLYPLLPWIGVIALGYYFGNLCTHSYASEKRKKIFLFTGFAAIELFFLLRLFNIYGDAVQWTTQKNVSFTVLSFLNVTKYPPSLLYNLITLGPAMIFLSLAEKPLNSFA